MAITETVEINAGTGTLIATKELIGVGQLEAVVISVDDQEVSAANPLPCVIVP